MIPVGGGDGSTAGAGATTDVADVDIVVGGTDNDIAVGGDDGIAFVEDINGDAGGRDVDRDNADVNAHVVVIVIGIADVMLAIGDAGDVVAVTVVDVDVELEAADDVEEADAGVVVDVVVEEVVDGDTLEGVKDSVPLSENCAGDTVMAAQETTGYVTFMSCNGPLRPIRSVRNSNNNVHSARVMSL